MKVRTRSQGRNYRWQVVVGFLLGLWLSACGAVITNRVDPGTNVQPSVVSTSTIITDWATQLGGEIQLTGILQPGDDPHVYEPVPRDSIAFEKADLILYNGYNLEPGLIRLMNAAGVNARKLAVGEVIQPLQLEEQGTTVPDPHVWGDVENAIAIVNAIRDAFIELLPEEREVLTQNAANYTAQLQQLHTWVTQQIQTIPPENRRLVTTHDAFQYYANAYDLEIFGTLIGISTEEQPSAQTVRQLSDAIRDANVPTIFAETTINPALIQTVAAEAGVELATQPLYSDSIGPPGSNADSYIKMIIANTRTIVEALGGNYTPFPL
ncbi:zinc ABC transporter substrate-binding protein [Gloeocapsopsis crepidinum LEGE 06123]|uniref:Zinc ABC transporter substrate-binding protein n=1 Tax=Gloeocapsopsis crepidinum LEGE 06123 TaxID=588587 RepID=A0ABR9UPF7_9CHRO|nr:zinc ABC transporter substrate-binding protein [Gloeocapsopsis crepidinum]MBE9190174.1 zinc ABC transporter substrate-binding protein [Gloeocapsopsis crepidinum LEGE 06123]